MDRRQAFHGRRRWYLVSLISIDGVMTDEGRFVTAKLPETLVSQMDEVAKRIDRSKSWIMRQAVAEWLAEEQRRYELTLEALKSVEEGRLLSQDEVDGHFVSRRKPQSR